MMIGPPNMIKAPAEVKMLNLFQREIIYNI
jgi:hypothetical protein